jgi:hypothetical protein
VTFFISLLRAFSLKSSLLAASSLLSAASCLKHLEVVKARPKGIGAALHRYTAGIWCLANACDICDVRRPGDKTRLKAEFILGTALFLVS